MYGLIKVISVATYTLKYCETCRWGW